MNGGSPSVDQPPSDRGGASAPVCTDGQLLQRFVAEHAEAAFQELVRRHGPMVLQTCHRVLHHTQDAEDVFQATFIVLMRKAAKVAKLESVGGWLHGVAYRTALNANKVRAQRRLREREVAAEAGGRSEPAANDLRAVLDEELNRLPEKYRLPVVLCYLEGKTNDEVAQQLRWPAGTVKIRLSRARDRLRARLTRRGLSYSAGALLALLAQNSPTSAAIPTALTASTAKVATAVAAGNTAAGVATAQACSLAEASVKAMALLKAKVAAGVVLTAAAPPLQRLSHCGRHPALCLLTILTRPKSPRPGLLRVAPGPSATAC